MSNEITSIACERPLPSCPKNRFAAAESLPLVPHTICPRMWSAMRVR
jgi:hypothetical protein